MELYHHSIYAMELMWSSLALATSLLTQFMMEFGVFLLVDSVVKTSLRSLRTSLERRRMWLLESLVLLLLATSISIYGHVTYVLYILSFSTMASSLLHHQVDWQRFLPSAIYNAESFLQTNSVNTCGLLTSVNGLSHCSPLGTIQNNSKYLHGVPNDPTCTYNGEDQVQKRRQNCVTVPIGLVRENVTKLMSYFQGSGRRKPTEYVPPGLPNEGMNLCFLNTVIQCLAHALSHCGVDEVIPQMRDNCKDMDFIDCCSQLIANCTSRYNSDAVLDTIPFRRAASKLCPSLIVHPSIRKQTQQDAAEFLTWLLTTLHSALKKVGSLKRPSYLQTNSGVGNLSEKNRQLLRDECQMLLQTSKSMYDSRCVKAVQVLCDLDWLHQQSQGSSIIEEVFCGQILELRENGCRNCVSIGIQAFNVLPVPLSGPRPISGVVYLQDCIDDMCALNGALVESPCHSFASVKQETDVGSVVTNGPCLLNPSLCKPTVSSSSTSTKCEILTSQEGSACKSSDFRCKTSLCYLPKCLILQLNRFNEYGHKEKIPVNIPLHGLNLSPTLFDQQVASAPVSNGSMFVYDLAALCVHKGTGSSCYGHYVAFCLASNSQWYCMDDEHVSKVNMAFECNSSLVRENTYLLFYVRRN